MRLRYISEIRGANMDEQQIVAKLRQDFRRFGSAAMRDLPN